MPSEPHVHLCNANDDTSALGPSAYQVDRAGIARAAADHGTPASAAHIPLANFLTPATLAAHQFT